MNYFLTSKHSRLTGGHLKASDLYKKILAHDGSTAFCCYFNLKEQYLKNEFDTGTKDKDGKTIYKYLMQGEKNKNPDWKFNGKTFTQYEGPCEPALDMISFDFDDEENPQNALDDVRRFCEWLDTDNLVVFFSGKKGFHIMVPFGYFDLEATEHLPLQLKDLAKYLKEFYPTLDDSIYNYNRKFRVPFSKHDKSGLHKVNMLTEWDLLTVQKFAKENTGKQDFLKEIDFKVKPIEVISEALEASKRKSYVIEKERAGNLAAPSPFESFDNKLCIKKMLENRCDDIGRNNAAMRIVNDYFRSGKTQSKCESDLFEWSKGNDLAMSEISAIISNIYQRGSNYNFGCQDECKSQYCSAKCDIWKKLAVDKRPITVDMPNSALIKNRQAKIPKEFDVVKKVLLDTFFCKWDDKYKKFDEGFICKQGKKDLFFYKEDYWQHLNDEQIDLIKIKFNAIYDNALSTRLIDSIFKMFMMYVPSKPNDIDMFVPKSNVANFKNGTLHLITDFVGNYSLDFRDHDKNDFITFKVNHDYNPALEAVNKDFEEWLLEYLSGDKEQFNLVQEMFGASLVPTFPQVFFLLGLSGTGKTTLIKVLKLIHGNDESNICGVAPHQFNGFHMSSMVGKLVNIVSDINVHAKIDDDIIKQIEDRDSIRIDRKGQDDIYAPLPALHLFGANRMPRTLEGYSGALDRRASIINFNKVFSGTKNRNIAKVLFDSNPQGVIDFAVRGLTRLACSNQGFFSKSTKSTEAVSSWTSKDDVIQLFLNDAKEGLGSESGENYLVKDKNKTIKKAAAWNLFDDWQAEALDRNDVMGRNRFYQLMDVKGFSIKIKRGTHFFIGLGESDTVIVNENLNNSI